MLSMRRFFENVPIELWRDYSWQIKNRIKTKEEIERYIKLLPEEVEGIERTKDFLSSGFKRGLIFTNLVDFDSRYGHRNNPKGFAAALEEFDKRLPEIISPLKDKDILIITSDHGCDPTTPSTDHSREYVLLLIYGKGIKAVNLGIRNTFADLGASIADLLGATLPPGGESFAEMLSAS